MKVLELDHITINCLDIDLTRSFYEEFFNLRPLNKVDLGDHVLHYYELPGTRLELIEYIEEQKIYQTGNTDQGIYRHMAVVVDDLEEAFETCKARNIPINLEPKYIPQIDKKIMLIKDPNGVEIELIQK